ncbi:hypothetical protein J3Q64DRAFT_1260625 [Phycomyces blakesleeanus]|uniref:Uncharacterized protein n=1 Tax=Phycomyces blakesleeanus TaxID=4837 RepID=A0ABR3ARX3_PHYBL
MIYYSRLSISLPLYLFTFLFISLFYIAFSLVRYLYLFIYLLILFIYLFILLKRKKRTSLNFLVEFIHYDSIQIVTRDEVCLFIFFGIIRYFGYWVFLMEIYLYAHTQKSIYIFPMIPVRSWILLQARIRTSLYIIQVK